MRMRSFSTTVKWLAQSPRVSMAERSVAVRVPAEPRTRDRMMPLSAGSPARKGELAEVLVRREEHAAFRRGAGEDLFVRTPGSIGADPGDVVAEPAERLDRDRREILIGEEAHGIRC